MARTAVITFLAMAIAMTSTASAESTAGRSAAQAAGRAAGRATVRAAAHAAAHATAHTAGRAAAHATAHSSVTPVQKVLELLGGMETKGKNEMQEEAVAYAETEKWCTIEKEQLSSQISATAAQIEELTADIAKQSSLSATLAEEMKALEGKIAETDAELKSASAERKKENADFKAAQADMLESITAVDRAITTLKAKSADIPQTSLIQISQSRFLDPGSKSLIQAFLNLKSGNSDLEAAPPEANIYEFQSGGIVGMLEKLAMKFQSQKNSLEKEEMSKQSSFELFAQTLTDDMEAAKDTLAKKTSLKAAADESLATATSSKDRAVESITVDKKTLSDTTAECSAKAKEFATNQATRRDELRAIAKALEIIKGGEVAGHAKTYLPAASMLQDVAAAFAHLRKKVRSHDDPRDVAEHISSLLEGRAKKLHSRVLELVAVRSKYDPLGKVRDMIKGLIRNLMEKANAEMEDHAGCSKELHENTLTRKQKTQEIEQMSADLDKKKAQYELLSTEIEDLGKDIVAITKAQKEAVDIRTKDKTRNLKAIEDAKEAQEAVSRAMVALKDFYEPGGSSASLLQGQTGVISDDMEKVASQAPYTGMAGEGSSVLGLLDVVLSDFARLESETQSDEDSDAEAHKTYMEESTNDIALKNAQQDHLKDKNDEINRKIIYFTKQISGTQEELDAAEQYYEGLKADCIDTGLSYEDRKEKRAEEIRSLKEALEVLNAEELTEIDTTTR